MADKKIQIKDKSGNNLYPAIDLSLSNNIGTLPNEKIAGVDVSKLSGTLPINKGGTGSTTSSGARTNLDVYSKTEIDSLIAGIDRFQYQVVTTLPPASADTMFIIYLVDETGNESGSYVQYITIDNGPSADPRYVWKNVGTTATDLTEYSKNTHKHTFTGSEDTLSVSGTYSKVTGVTIGTGTGTVNYTPSGTVTTVRTADVAVNTTTVNSITGVGSLPTLTEPTTSAIGDISMLKDVSASHTLTVNHTDPSFSTTDVYSITGVGSLPTMTHDTTPTDGQAYIKSLAKGNYTPEGTISATFTGTEVSKNVTITPVGSIALGSNTTESGGVKYVESISSTAASGTTSYIHPTTTNVVTEVAANGTTTAVTGVAAAGTAEVLTGTINTTKYLNTIFTGTEVSKDVSIIPVGSITLTSGTAPSLTFSSTSTNDYKQYVQDISSTGARASSTDTFIKSINAGSGSLTTSTTSTAGDISYISDVSLTGGGVPTTSSYANVRTGGSTGDGVTLTGSVTNRVLTITGTTTSSYLYGTNTTTINGVNAVGSLPTLTTTLGYLHHTHTGASAESSSSAVTGVTGGTTEATYSYMHFSAGTTPVSSASFTGSSSSANITFTPTGSVALTTSTVNSTGAVKYLEGFTVTSAPVLTDVKASGTATVLTGVKASGTTSVITGLTPRAVSTTDDIAYISAIGGGNTTATTKYFHPAFTGATSTGTVTITPEGSVTGTFTGSSTSAFVTDGTVSYMHFTPGSLPTRSEVIKPYTGISTTGSSSLSGDISINKTTGYLRFSQGSLPTKGSDVTVATGIKTQPAFNSTFSGTGTQLTANVTNTATTITSTGEFTPSGTIGTAE